MAPYEAVAVAILTLAVVVTRPRGLNEGIAALGGAALVLLLRLVSPATAAHAVLGDWNVFLFFLGMMALAALADQSGVFDIVAYEAARRSSGSVLRLYLAVCLLGTLISLLFANDSAALVLTPIVYALVVRLSLDPLPFVFATTFIADTASIGLPVSNPLNVIVSDGFSLSLGSYVQHLWLPALLVVGVNVCVFLLLFRRHLGGRLGRMPAPQHRPGLAGTGALLLLLAVGYLAASATGVPLGVVAVVGAGAVTVQRGVVGDLDSGRMTREIGWPIFGFIAGMLLIVQALADTHVTVAFGHVLAGMAGHTPLRTIAVAVVGTAIGANVINNLPMAFVMVSTVKALHLSAGVRTDLIYGTVLGCDLGPNLTHLGSLATFIWLFFLRRKGVNITAWDYVRVGVVVTPPMLLAAIIGLWLTSG